MTRARDARRPGISSSGSIVIVTRSSGSRPRRASSAPTLLTVVSITSVRDDIALTPLAKSRPALRLRQISRPQGLVPQLACEPVFSVFRSACLPVILEKEDLPLSPEQRITAWT